MGNSSSRNNTSPIRETSSSTSNLISPTTSNLPQPLSSTPSSTTATEASRQPLPLRRSPRMALVVELYFIQHARSISEHGAAETTSNSPPHGEIASSATSSANERDGLQSIPANLVNERDVSLLAPQPVRRILLLLNEEIASRVIQGNAESELHNILNHLLQMHEPRGPPPTSKKALQALPEITVDIPTKETAVRCSVCFDDFQLGAKAIQLPCKHIFDKNCLLPWLSEHNTCPHCRYELPVDDEEYEKERRQRMKSREDIDEASFFNWNSNTVNQSMELENCTSSSSTTSATDQPIIPTQVTPELTQSGNGSGRRKRQRETSHPRFLRRNPTREKRKRDSYAYSKFQRYLVTEKRRRG